MRLESMSGMLYQIDRAQKMACTMVAMNRSPKLKQQKKLTYGLFFLLLQQFIR